MNKDKLDRSKEFIDTLNSIKDKITTSYSKYEAHNPNRNILGKISEINALIDVLIEDINDDVNKEYYYKLAYYDKNLTLKVVMIKTNYSIKSFVRRDTWAKYVLQEGKVSSDILRSIYSVSGISKTEYEQSNLSI